MYCLPLIINPFDKNVQNNRPPIPIGYPLGIPIAVNLEDDGKVEFDPAKLVSDDSSSDTKNIDTEN